MKNISTTLFLCMIFLHSCSTPTKQFKQKQMIESNKIEIGMNCQDLTSDLGGYRAITYFYLEKKEIPDSLSNSFLLLSTTSDNSNQFFYLCDRSRANYINIISSGKKHINDYDLIKIFNSPKKMLKYILTVISEDSRDYFFRAINLADYNITLIELRQAFEVQKLYEGDSLDREIQKAEKMLEEKKEEEKGN